jgi:hypothetical protein
VVVVDYSGKGEEDVGMFFLQTKEKIITSVSMVQMSSKQEK